MKQDEEEYTFINKEDLEEHKDSEVPTIKKEELLNIKTISEKKNRKHLKKKLNEKLSPLIKRLEEVNDEILWEINEITDDLIEGNSFKESRFDALDTISDFIAHHKVIHDNINSINKIITKL